MQTRGGAADVTCVLMMTLNKVVTIPNTGMNNANYPEIDWYVLL